MLSNAYVLLQVDVQRHASSGLGRRQRHAMYYMSVLSSCPYPFHFCHSPA